MILHDRVMVITGGVRDAGGNVLPIVKNGPFPANVRPLRSSETMIHGGVLLTAYYRLVIGRAGGSLLTYTGAIEWGGKRYAVQGDVEPHHVNGRLHHYEATVKRG